MLRRLVSRPTVVRVRSCSSKLAQLDTFARRHNGPASELDSMLDTIGVKSVEELISKTVPENIRLNRALNIGTAKTEAQFLKDFKKVAQKNKILKSYIGMGYYNTFTPNVILRNIVENPLWYTPYTPYQAEMAQGRLESLLNFQTMVTDLTGMDIANASLLDEATAAAEAMSMAYAESKMKKKGYFIDKDTHPQTIELVKTRAEPLGVEVHIGDFREFDPKDKDIMGCLISYPTSTGKLRDYKLFAEKIHAEGAIVSVASDLLALASLAPPSEFGADIVFGNSQRFGVPLGYGGPHAAFFSTTDKLKRRMPGRIIGVSRDVNGKQALRMALQTREQHIRREKATSNVCTAQALLANVAANFAVYHGPQGIKDISTRVNHLTAVLNEGLTRLGYSTSGDEGFFDTITVTVDSADAVLGAAVERGINLRRVDDTTVGLSMDETVAAADLADLFSIFADVKGAKVDFTPEALSDSIEQGAGLSTFARNVDILRHPIFSAHNSEHDMLRYLHRLASKDITMAHSMYPLGSCTMKLNATTEMIPITWPELNSIHPFVPLDQATGYAEMFAELDAKLSEITGFAKVDLQPNSGAQGEYAGLRTIDAYHKSRGEGHRNVCLIPVSAHGTNPASASMCNMKVVPLKVTKTGAIDISDLKEKLEKHSKDISALMVTYPSTYGIFDDNIKEICELIHGAGGQVYLDGANMNAQVGLCRPGDIGADVCHLNLHKTFCIPHGGGGPGMGPIGVAKHLTPFLPTNAVIPTGGDQPFGAVSAAPWSSASILAISHSYINLMGASGLREATERAIINANYMMKRLDGHYKILFRGSKGFCAHEFIVDLSPFKKSAGVEPGDVAKRLMDYGFHAPTMQFPVLGTLMIEPTESETKDELDRYCDALIQIREEIRAIEEERMPRDNNLLKNAPHTAEVLTMEGWSRPYTRHQAAYPLPWVMGRHKFWPSVSRVDDVYGDLNLQCSCPPMATYYE